MKRLFSIFALGLVAFAGTSLRAQDQRDIVDTASAINNLTTLVKALQAAGLVDTLKGAGPFTVLAPTDEAFAKLPAGALDKLLANPDQLKKVLLYHVIPGKNMSTDVAKMTSAKTAEGGTVHIKSADGNVMINRATVAKADIECTNGVIHVIDTVLMPKM